MRIDGKWLLGGILLGLFLFGRSGRPQPGSSSSRKTTTIDRNAIVDVLARQGYPAAELDAAIMIESGWRPGALNPDTHAAGLQQIMPSQLPGLGWNDGPEAFARLGSVQQLPYMEAWWKRLRGRWQVPGDTYLALAASAYIGAADETVIYRQGSAAWGLNPAWRSPDDGDVTAGSIRAFFLGRLHG